MQKRKNSTMDIVRDLKLMLNESPSMTLESFMMSGDDHSDVPPRDDSFNDEDMYDVEFDDKESKQDITGIEKELTQIRKIALSVINRLADQPTSPQYDTMKKIWNMVDKAIEQPSKGEQNPNV